MSAPHEQLVSALVAAVTLGGAAMLARPVRSRRPMSSRARWGATAVIIVALALLLDLPWRGLGPVVLALAAVAGFASVRTRRQRARAAAVTGASVQEVCELLGAELATGLPVDRCLDEAARVWTPMGQVARAHRLAGSVPEALRAAATLPGAGDLRLVAGAWQVAAHTGSGLAESLAEVAQTLREREATRRLVRSELASARSTAKLMAALPVLTLAMGSGVGGDPVRFLLATPLGLGCLGVGLLLSVLGLRWIEAISANVEAST